MPEDKKKRKRKKVWTKGGDGLVSIYSPASVIDADVFDTALLFNFSLSSR